MTQQEFDDQAAAIGAQLAELPDRYRIAAACRGSGNPAALTWIAEGLRLDASSRVVDLGAGLGGPAAWLSTHYGCQAVVLEPASGQVRAAREVFAAPVVRGGADAVPFAADSFDAGLLLGVLSVLDDRAVALREARRVARSLGVMDYCGTGGATVHAGGSSFVTAEQLVAEVGEAGWRVVQSAPVSLPAPATWDEARDAVDVEPDPNEDEVVEAIESGALAPFMLVAER